MDYALTAFCAAVAFTCFAEAYIKSKDRGASKATDEHTKRNLVVLMFTGIFFALALWFAHTTTITTTNTAFTIGATVILIGITFRLYAVHTLGEYFKTFVVIQKKHKVISHGPYKYLRHPSYTGLLVYMIGVGIASNNYVALAVVFVLTFVGLHQRIRHEERVLSKSLGKEYIQYMRKTKRLVPLAY